MIQIGNSPKFVSFSFYKPAIWIIKATSAAPTATVRSPRLKYANITAITKPAVAEETEPVLEKTAGTVIAESTT